MSNDTISSGTRSGVTLAAGDTLTVLNGGTIKAGAEADNSGGTVANATIAGGLLNLSNNAATTGTIAFTAPAGTLEFDDTATPAATLAGFDRTDTIDLFNLTDVADATVAAGTNNRLTIAEGSVAVSLQFDPAQNLTGKPFLESADATGGTLLTFACFAAGTTIATTNGSVAVEHLRVWDQLLRPGHPPVPVIWIGRRHPDPERVQPIRILAGAFAPGIPARDLLLSPDRAIYAKGHLIPVRALLNDATVTRSRPEKSRISTSNCPPTTSSWRTVWHANATLTPAIATLSRMPPQPSCIPTSHRAPGPLGHTHRTPLTARLSNPFAAPSLIA